MRKPTVEVNETPKAELEQIRTGERIVDLKAEANTSDNPAKAAQRHQFRGGGVKFKI